MNQSLGNLEETVLLIVAVIPTEAYGYTVSEAYYEHIKSRISISAIHTVLKRLEKKGFIKSKMGGATAERGGRRKRIFEVTKLGLSTLQELQESRQKLWQMMPKLNFSY
ncbi:MAG: PadR family transcriptional regulator [Cytophagia bacterium]|nr:PadR family transcriptional regulator [Cytophagia bacterium]